MALVNAAASYLRNTASPISAVPFTMAAWLFPTSTAAATVFMFRSAASIQQRWDIEIRSGPLWRFSCNDGGASANVDSTGVPVTGAWHFIVMRGITTTNRRMDILYPSGATEHVQSVTSKTPTGIDTITVGDDVGSSAAGNTAEFWYTNSDIQPDGGALDDGLLRQIAYGGPFSVPHIARSIVEYHSFRAQPVAGRFKEDYYGCFGPRSWTSTGSPTIGLHPPLPHWYIRPGQKKMLLQI